MSREITDKTWVLVTRSLGRFYVTEEQADQIKQAIDLGSRVEVEGNTIMVNDIAGIVTGNQIANLERVKRGDWECEYGHWHTRGQECAHGQLARSR